MHMSVPNHLIIEGKSHIVVEAIHSDYELFSTYSPSIKEKTKRFFMLINKAIDEAARTLLST